MHKVNSSVVKKKCEEPAVQLGFDPMLLLVSGPSG